MDYFVFLDLAIIVIFAKLCGLVARKLKAPMVVGQIIAGLILGPSVLNLVQIQNGDFLSYMSEIGVIMLMFSAGLQTNIQELKKTGFISTLIACAGVFVPLVMGTGLYMLFYGTSPWGSTEFLKAVFIGVIMTATSVSITVETLKELGKLKTHIGTTIASAAIIDDVIGIAVLTFVVGMQDTPGIDGVEETASSSPFRVVLMTAAFFAFALLVGFVVYLIFKAIDEKYPHTRRIPIAGLALCFLMAFCAEHFFGIADITGAYVAGIILCSIRDSDYISEKMDINSYMLFGPVFFASIGLKTTISGLNSTIILFVLAFVIVAMAGKIIGCYLVSRICKFNRSDSLKVGIGMMTRGEVALIVSQKGLMVGLMDPVYFTAVILLIVASSVITPIFLKVIYSRDEKKGNVAA